MNTSARTNDERIKALERIGYSELEAGFLCLAALHGGYFLRRQFAHFLGRQDGGTVTQLMQKALGQNHVRTSTWRQNTQLYHLCARPFYEALGQGDNRNRRPREVPAIKNKIMALDFVLAHRQAHYLATEQEKLDYFIGQLQLELATLPSKGYQSTPSGVTTTRYFVDKYPISISPKPQEGATPLTSFCFVDEGLVSLSRFETYLTQYRPLFESLSTFHLVYVAGDRTHFGGARTSFERYLIRGSSGSNGRGSDREIDRLLAYFKARRLYEQQQFASFDRSQLIGLREARDEFSRPDHEALYANWQATCDGAIREILTPKRTSADPVRGTFSTYFLEHDYGLFGSDMAR
jgi:hypothetical protein